MNDIEARSADLHAGAGLGLPDAVWLSLAPPGFREIPGQLRQSNRLGMAQGFPIGIQQAGGVVWRDLFEDGQDQRTARKEIDGQEGPFELGFVSFAVEGPAVCRNFLPARTLPVARATYRVGHLVFQSSQGLGDYQLTRPG